MPLTCFRPAVWRCLLPGLLLAGTAGATTADPESGPATRPWARPVTPVNMVLGTQAIGGPYQLTDAPYLLEVARELEAMGSNFIKFTVGPRYAGEPYHLDPIPGVRSMRDLVVKSPVFAEVLRMPFRYYHLWANVFAEITWKDGVSAAEEDLLYAEFRELAEYFLREFNGSGKAFYLGHWEGDWLLIGAMDPNRDPTSERIAGFIQYLQIRQRAVDDARRAVPHENVEIFHYTEVNLVRKGLDGTRPTLTNAVLPHVDVDYVSYSSYDSQPGTNMRATMHESLDHIESKMVRRPGVEGKRVFVGEFGLKAVSVDYDPQLHEQRNREIARAIIEWGCPFAVYWQFYCNEPNAQRRLGYEGFWLVDPMGVKYPLYETFRDYWQAAAAFARQVEAETGAPPVPEALREFALSFLSAP